MPTIIDALVVELGLDPRGFVEGQRQAIESLRRFERGADRSSRRIEETAGQRIARFFTGLRRPLDDTQKGLRDLSNETRRHGVAMASGIDAATVSFQNLVKAGLAAFAALKAVQGTMRDLAATSERTVGTGLAAMRAGTGVGFTSRVALAAQSLTGADPAATEAAVASIRQSVERAKAGLGWDAVMDTLARLGVDISAPVEDIVTRQLPAALRRRTLPEAIAFGSAMGFDQRLVEALRKGPQQFQAAMQQAGLFAVTPEQFAAIRQMTLDLQSVDRAWQSLNRTVLADVSPTLGALAQRLRDVLAQLQNSPAALKAVEAAAVALGSAATLSALTKFATAVLGVAGAAATLATAIAAIGMVAGSNKAVSDKLPLWKRLALALGLGPVGALFSGGMTIGNWLSGIAPSIFGEKSPVRAPSSAASGAASGDNVQYLSSIIAAAGGNANAQAGLLSNFAAESGLSPSAVNPNGGATGFAQWIGARKARLEQIAAQMGVSPTSREAQGALLLEELTGRYRNALLHMNAAATPQDAALIGLREFEGVNEGNSLDAGAPWERMVATHIAKAQAYADMIRSAQTAATGNLVSNLSSDNRVFNNNRTVGDVNVYVPPGSDGFAVGRAVSDAIRRQLMTSTANTGIE
ncbi:MAG TPA: phage tail tip lysozyme [Stellaceae bacterium]|nr:phage tail tip lysozyme [Stellaceae bacterium]